MTCFEQALAIARRIGDRSTEGNALGNLGVAYFDLGQADRSITYQEQWLAIARALGDRQHEAYALNNLGNASYALAQTKRAIDYYKLIIRAFGMPSSVGAMVPWWHDTTHTDHHQRAGQ
jgi:tetratricopeptide (TPR) repeat protein